MRDCSHKKDIESIDFLVTNGVDIQYAISNYKYKRTPYIIAKYVFDYCKENSIQVELGIVHGYIDIDLQLFSDVIDYALLTKSEIQYLIDDCEDYPTYRNILIEKGIV